MSPPDETATVINRPAGREASMAALMALHERGVRSALRRVMGRSRDEDDLVQEVFTRLVVRLRQPGEINAGAWLRGVARNLAVDEIRRRRPVPVEQARLDRPCAASADDGVAGAELYTCLVDGAQGLPDRQRAALAASLAGAGGSGVGGAGVAGVASSLGVSVHAAESLLSRARVGLRAHLAGAGHGADAGRVRLSTGTALGAVAAVLAGLGRRWRAVAVVLATAGGAVSMTGAVVLPAIGEAAPPAAVPAAAVPATPGPVPPAGAAANDQPREAAGEAGAAAPSAAPSAAPGARGGTGAGGSAGAAPLAGLPLPTVPVDLGVDLPLPECLAVPPPPALPPLDSGLLDTVTGAVEGAGDAVLAGTGCTG